MKLPTDATNDGWVLTDVSLVLASFLLAFDYTDYLSQYAKVHRRGMGMRYSEAFRAKITQG